MRRRAAVLAALLAGSVAAVPARAAGELPRCRVIDFSPAFERDGTAFCASVLLGSSAESFGVLRFYRTTNHGRSWHRRPAAGLERIPFGGNGNDVDQIVVSPRFGMDHQLVVQLQEAGIFLSQDAGASFVPVAPGATPATALPTIALVSPPNVAAFQETTAASGEPAAAFGYAGAVPRKVLTAPAPVAVPAVAALPDQVVANQFLVSPLTGPTRHRLLAGTSFDLIGRFRVDLWSCDPDLHCEQRLYRSGAETALNRFWLPPDFERSRTVLAWVTTATAMGLTSVAIGHGAPRTEMRWSRDGGRTFTTMPSVDRLLRAIYDQRAHTNCSEVGLPRLGMSFDRGRWYLRVSGWTVKHVYCPPNPSPPAPPGDAIYESRDAGRSWRRIASGLGADQPGRSGSMPWHDLAGPLSQRGDLAVRAGRLFVIARQGGYEGVFCSVDHGRTWSPLCAR